MPTPARGQILVKIAASGVCHTDLHAADGDWPVKPALPFIPGHEGVGYVSAVGADVKSVKEGDRVGVPWLYSACGHCEHCLSGWETLCHDQQNTGYSVNGGYAEYVLADPNYVGHLPSQVGFEEIAPILCAGVTVYKGIRMTDTRPGQWLAISGIGGLGHVAVQYAIAMGLHVVAIVLSPPSSRSPANWERSSPSTLRPAIPQPRSRRRSAAHMACWSRPSRAAHSRRRSAWCAVAEP